MSQSETPVAPTPGMVTIKNTRDGSKMRVFPIDAVEIMRHSDDYALVEDGAMEAGKLNGAQNIREAEKQKQARVSSSEKSAPQEKAATVGAAEAAKAPASSEKK